MAAETSKLLESLKKLLKSKNKTYGELARDLGLSEPTVKRMFSQKTITMDRFATVCEVLGVSVLDVAKLSQGRALPGDDYLSYEQEEFLSRNEKLFVLYNLLRKNWSPAQITKKFLFSDDELTRALIELDRQKLIELHPKNRVRLLIENQLEWLPDGPVWKMYQKQVREDFFNYNFEDKTDRLRFMTCEISSHTLKLILKKMDRVAAEIADLITTDENMNKKESQGVAFVLGGRPWVFEVLRKYQRSV